MTRKTNRACLLLPCAKRSGSPLVVLRQHDFGCKYAWPAPVILMKTVAHIGLYISGGTTLVFSGFFVDMAEDDHRGKASHLFRWSRTQRNCL